MITDWRTPFIETLAIDYERMADRYAEDASYFKLSIELADQYHHTPEDVERYTQEWLNLKALENEARAEAKRLRKE